MPDSVYQMLVKDRLDGIGNTVNYALRTTTVCILLSIYSFSTVTKLRRGADAEGQSCGAYFKECFSHVQHVCPIEKFGSTS